MSYLRGALWRLRLALYGPSLQHLQQLRRWSKLPADEVAKLQQERLAAFLSYAHERVPYYRQLLAEAGVVSPQGVDLERFHLVPLLDKGIIRERFDDLRAAGFDDKTVELNTSGGSTGEPVGFLQDREKATWNTAVSMLFDEWAGTGPGDRRVLLWGASRDLAPSSGSLSARAGTWLRNEIQFNAFHLSEKQMREYVERFNDFRPRHLLAYAQSLYQWASFIEAEGLSIWSPSSIITSATTLEPHMRETIERVFKARVFNRYGSREVGGIACDASDGHGLAISALTHYVEILAPDGSPAAPGEVGEVVVTLLTNRVMPLIRYRIADAAVPASSPTTAPFWPRLASLAGRMTDIFYSAAGDQVYGGYFTSLFYYRDWVAQFQVIQKAYDHLLVRIVPVRSALSDELYASERATLSARIREVLGANCRVEYELVDAIEPGPSGKRRYTISEVGPPPAAEPP